MKIKRLIKDLERIAKTCPDATVVVDILDVTRFRPLMGVGAKRDDDENWVAHLITAIDVDHGIEELEHQAKNAKHAEEH